MELVDLLHKKGTPWETVYVEGKNKVIPDDYTKMYYKMLVNTLLRAAKAKE